MKKLSFLSLCLAAAGLFAEIVKTPDANTLWLENANPLKFHKNGHGGWQVSGAKVTQIPGGFELDSRNSRGYCGMYIPISKEYPYLEFDLEFLDKGPHFSMWSWAVNRGTVFAWNKKSVGGYFVQDLLENAPRMPVKGSVFYQFACRDMRIRITNLRMVKKPRIHLQLDNNFFATRKCLQEDALLTATVSSRLKASGPVELVFEDVSRGIKMDFNDNASWELKPVAGKTGQYQAQEEVKSLTLNNIGSGKMMIEIQGFGQKAFTWLCQPWQGSAKFNPDHPLSRKTDWIKNIRPDHPRLFINKDILPKVKAWAEKIGYKQLLADADNFEVNPAKTIKKRGNVGNKRPYSTQDVYVAKLQEEEALTCALAYLLTDDKKYIDKTWKFLEHNLSVYKDSAAKRTSINWYGIGRIQNMAALDWIWNSDVPRAKKYLKEFIDVNIGYARHGWWGPYFGINGGSGRTGGFYGDSNTELPMGIMAYKEGICDDLAMSMLKEGYKKYRECMNFRDTMAEDDGMLSSPTVGYSAGQYPWVSYDFLFMWRALFKKPVKLPQLTHLQYFAEWFQWNTLPGKGKIPIRCYGYGDNEHSNMRLFGVSGHLYPIIGAYAAQYPREAAQIAAAIARTDGKFDPDHYKEKGKIYKRKKAPAYHWGFFRRYLSYDLEKVKLPTAKTQNKKANARQFRTGGLTFMRSGTAKDSTYALFAVGGIVPSHKGRGDENHFTIFKKGFLAIDSGYREDTWYGPLKYHLSSLAHNTMLIHDPQERFTGDAERCEVVFKRWHFRWKGTDQDELYKKHKPFFADAEGGQDKVLGGKCRAFSTNNYYSYILGDASKVYSEKKCREFNRQFIHIQPDVFIIFDRVESTKAEFQKEWLLHFLEEPVVKGNVTTARVSDEGGILRCTSLLPKGGVITKIGGPGKEFMGKNVNWGAPAKFLDKFKYTGAWRINLSPAKPAKRDYFLNVIDVGEKAVRDIRLTEDAKTAAVTFTTPQGRKVTAVFNKTGRTGGRIRIEEKGKVLCDEALTQRVQPQSGFLY